MRKAAAEKAAQEDLGHFPRKYVVLGLRASGLGFKGFGLRAQGSGFRVQGLGCRI